MAYSEKQAFELISSAHHRGRLGHAFLIVGSEATGAHNLASRMVNLVNGDPTSDLGLDLFGEAAIQPNEKPTNLNDLEGELVRLLRPEKKSRIISVDAMRTFERSLYLASPSGKWTIGIIEPADRMNEAAANAFLKTLEEPPAQTLLILITAQPEQLLRTILSRCLNIHLINHEPEPISEAETQLLQSISNQCKNGFKSQISALNMKAVFSTLLAQCKNEISKANDLALKDEQAQYAKATEGNWMKERQEYYKARIESEYLRERSRLINTLVSWFGDIVREKCNFPHFDYPQLKSLSSAIAKSEPLDRLLVRLDSLEKLRDALNTSAEEKLALEVGFLNAFG